ncbi:MAG TPA: hypothetical protein VMX97_13355 [Hyphomicrobiaceae bacterium]|nr:hypothetical protein [Hyphomicrobiaceae bacterium]
MPSWTNTNRGAGAATRLTTAWVSLVLLMLFLHAPAAAQTVGNCRISAMHLYCKMVMIVVESKAKTPDDKATVKKMKKIFEDAFDKHKNKKGSDKANGELVGQAIKDFQRTGLRTALKCIGHDQAGLAKLITSAKAACG